jgi:alkylhydroperoxidase family enzyme
VTDVARVGGSEPGADEPRIGPLAPEELDGEAMVLAAKLRDMHGLTTDALPETVATMLRHPDLYRAYIDFVGQRAKASVLSARDVEIVTLRATWLCGCGYVWGEHVAFGKKAGLSADEIEWLVEGSSAAGWNARDRALVRLVEELHETAEVTDETWAVLAAHFTDQQIIELLMLVGGYHEVAFLYNAMRVRLLPGSQGLAAR